MAVSLTGSGPENCMVLGCDVPGKHRVEFVIPSPAEVHFANVVSSLRTLGLVDYNRPGLVHGTDALWLELR